MSLKWIFFGLILFIASATAGNTDAAVISEDLPSLETENWPQTSNLLAHHKHHRHHRHRRHHHHRHHRRRHHHKHHHHRHHHHRHQLHRHHRHRHYETCNKSPKICRAEGSPGQSCCQNQCVDLMNDSLNCGRCGNRCSFGQTCCGGKCMWVMNDNWNCGGCNNKCGNGSYCKLGMCGYA